MHCTCVRLHCELALQHAPLVVTTPQFSSARALFPSSSRSHLASSTGLSHHELPAARALHRLWRAHQESLLELFQGRRLALPLLTRPPAARASPLPAPRPIQELTLAPPAGLEGAPPALRSDPRSPFRRLVHRRRRAPLHPLGQSPRGAHRDLCAKGLRAPRDALVRVREERKGQPRARLLDQERHRRQALPQGA